MVLPIKQTKKPVKVSKKPAVSGTRTNNPHVKFMQNARRNLVLSSMGDFSKDDFLEINLLGNSYIRSGIFEKPTQLNAYWELTYDITICDTKYTPGQGPGLVTVTDEEFEKLMPYAELYELKYFHPQLSQIGEIDRQLVQDIVNTFVWNMPGKKAWLEAVVTIRPLTLKQVEQLIVEGRIHPDAYDLSSKDELKFTYQDKGEYPVILTEEAA